MGKMTISSMTGVGIGEVRRDSYTTTVELKSVNNRFLEVSCRMPAFLSVYEREVKDLIRKSVNRGKIYVTISIQNDSAGDLDFRVEEQTVRAVSNLLVHLRETAGIQEELKLEHFLKFSDIFQSAKEPDDKGKNWNDIKKALAEALKSLRNMRMKEGEALAEDIVKRITRLTRYVREIEKIADKSVQLAHQRMMDRVKKLVAESELDRERLFSEIALMADRMDITEECVRLNSHHQLFLDTIRNDSVVGKKLNFLLQEMNRETNTLSAKATNAEISHIVVNMKDEIEKLREQVQNLE
jgi:uncharacterized protein (TIGR00255 family)